MTPTSAEYGDVPGPFHYTLQQRLVASDCALPFLTPAEAASPDVVLRFAAPSAPPPAPVTPWYRGEAVEISTTGQNERIVRFLDDTAFLVGKDGRSITLLSAPAHYTTGDLAAYALGPVIAIALHLQGAVLLHASAVLIKGRAILFAGESGSGKSTTAAILHRLGYTVLADDMTEIAGTSGALASSPTIRLWPQALEALFGSAAAFPDPAPSWDKKIVVTGSIGAEGPHDIAAILFLHEPGEVPRLEPLATREGWQMLMANSLTARLPDPSMARRIFEVTSALANRVPMYTFAPPQVGASADLGAFLEESFP